MRNNVSELVDDDPGARMNNETELVAASKVYSKEWFAERDARIEKVMAEGKRIRRQSAQARARPIVCGNPRS
jgi:hypothetical protein